MMFFSERRHHLVDEASTLGVQGGSQDEAIAMSQRIWDGLMGAESALGYSLLDSRTGRVCYVEVR